MGVGWAESSGAQWSLARFRTWVQAEWERAKAALSMNCSRARAMAWKSLTVAAHSGSGGFSVGVDVLSSGRDALRTCGGRFVGRCIRSAPAHGVRWRLCRCWWIRGLGRSDNVVAMLRCICIVRDQHWRRARWRGGLRRTRHQVFEFLRAWREIASAILNMCLARGPLSLSADGIARRAWYCPAKTPGGRRTRGQRKGGAGRLPVVAVVDV